MLGRKNKNIEGIKTFFNEQWKEMELIGEGSYGKVYKAKKEEFGIEVYSAIKQIEIPHTKFEVDSLKTEGMTQNEITTYYEKSVKKWVEEIKFMSSFKDCENVVNIEDYEIIKKKNEIGWIINIRMELLQNLNLYTVENNITDKEILKMAIDITKALEDCEEKKVVHRDVKPDNVFVNSKGIYKLGDFGIAKKVEKTVSNMSKKGTENYMAPELYKNEKGNKTVDIYSLGIMLYRYFNYNRLPFLPDYPEEITIESREEAIYKRVSGEKLKPPQNATRDIANVILKACNYYPKDRYQTAGKFRKELEILYTEIKEPRIVFDFNSKQMNKIFNKNKSEDAHEETLSIFNNTENKEQVEEIKEMVEKENKQEEQSQEKNIIEQEINIENNMQEKEEEQIKNPISIKLKSNIMKIIIGILILIIAIVLFLAVKSRKLEKQNNEHELVAMIELVGMTSEEATEKLKELGLKVEYEYVETENEEEIGKVLEQSISKDEQAEKGTVIKLKVAVSPEKIKVINVVGKTIEEATQELEKIGLTISIVEQNNEDVEAGKIISQMTAEGTEVAKGTTIEVLVSIGTGNQEEQNEQEKQSTTNKNSQKINKTTTKTIEQVQEIQEQPQQTEIPKVENIPVTSIKMGNKIQYLRSGSTYNFSSSISPSNATNKNVTWSSSNASIATVSQNGAITGKQNGTATITVTVQGTNVSDSFNVTVYTKGDMNGDGYVNSTDASMILDKKGSRSELDLLKGDIDGDGALTRDDANLILNGFKNN